MVWIGALTGATGIPFWPVRVAFGDWVSYWIGYRFKAPTAHIWPLSKHPDLLPRGHVFIERWGALGIFFGPLRATIPLITGILEIPYRTFQIANFTSAFVWAWALLVFSDFGIAIVTWLMGDSI